MIYIVVHRKMSVCVIVYLAYVIIYSLIILCWWFDARGTPDLIPNSEVKSRSGDGTRKGRVASRQHKVINTKNTCLTRQVFVVFESPKAR